MDSRVIYVGMDLGTYRTSVASSNGERGVMISAVGWPKDQIAREMLGTDVVFGEEVFRQRLALQVVRPFAGGALKYLSQSEAGLSDAQASRHQDAMRLLIRNAVGLVHPPREAVVYGVIGVPSRAATANKQMLLEAAKEVFDAVVLAPEPFVVAYGLGQLNNALVVDIGAGTIDICPMYGVYPSDEDQLTIAIGGDTVDEKFFQLVQEAYPEASLSKNMARQIKEMYGFVEDAGRPVLMMLPVRGQPRQFDVSRPLRDACSLLVSPIVDGIQELIARVDPEFQRSLLDNILLSGGGSQITGLGGLIERALAEYGGGHVTRIHDCTYAGATGALKLSMNLPAENWATIESLDQELPAANQENIGKAA